MKLLAIVAVATLVGPPAASQGPQRPDSTRRDPTNTLPLTTTRTVRFTTDQGTWMSVDVSPDGSTLVFDLLGDIYTVPVAGGKATRILGGNSIDAQPRFSPDGKSLVFTSDRSGVDATWLADADGRRLRLLTQGGQYPAWTPDGKQIVTGNRLVDVRGGAGVQPPGFGSAASFTGDGRYIWFQTGTQAARFDREKGTVSYRINLPGGVLRPMVSRDGKTLAYFTRYESQTALVVRDLATGGDRWVLMGTQPEAGGQPAAGAAVGGGGRGVGPSPVSSGVGPLPSPAWLPDGRGIVTSFGGKLWRVDVASGRSTQIPFTADVEQSLGPLVKGSVDIGDSIRVREIREPALSPDGRRVAFTGLGKIWVIDLNGGTARRLTSAAGIVETSPAWTPDGQSIVYATWVDDEGGDIFQVEASGGTPRNLSRAPAMYSRLNFSRDGSRLVFARAPRRSRTLMVDDAAVQARTPAGTGTELNFELRWMAAAGGQQHAIIMVADVGVLPLGGFPHFSPDTSRVFFHDASGLVSVRWDGSDRKVVLAGAAPRTVLSPDGSHVLSRAGRRGHIYLFERPQAADSLTIDPTVTTPAVPVRRLTRAGGDFPAWSRDGSKAVWSSGTSLYVYDVAQGDKATADSLAAALNRPPSDSAGGGRGGGRGGGGAADSTTRWAPAFDAARHDVTIRVAADKPAGVVVLRGGRIISMKDREVIENGDIVVTGNRITAVGPRGRVTIPSGARTIDVSGKTILPGYVDIHAQLAATSQIHRTIVPQYLANLAFGVTSTRDPETQSSDVFTYADRVATAELLGPRIFATGPTMLDSALTVRTMAEGRDFIRPYASSHPANTVRGDLAATRPDRQRFLMVTREAGLTPVAMGTPDFRKSLSAILDGYANHQSAYEVFPLYGDVAKLIAESGITYTPLMLGRVGNRNGIEHILATEAPHADPKVRRFYLHQDLDRIARARGTWMPPDEYPFQDVGAGAARIVAAGGKVGLGSNGKVHGLGFHWEMWLLAKGGMPNHDVLRAASIFGAEAIGAGTQLGSIEAGKLADLQVLDRNPLTDIRNTNSLRYVMKNGRLYDAATLDQITPIAKKMDKLWWLQLEPTEGAR